MTMGDIACIMALATAVIGLAVLSIKDLILEKRLYTKTISIKQLTENKILCDFCRKANSKRCKPEFFMQMKIDGRPCCKFKGIKRPRKEALLFGYLLLYKGAYLEYKP